MIFTGSVGGIVTPFLVGQVAEQAGMGVVAVFTAMLPASIVVSVASVKNSRS